MGELLNPKRRGRQPKKKRGLAAHHQLLSRIYYDHKSPASFGSVNALYEEASKLNPKITLQKVKSWLESQDTYTIHKPARKHFKRNKVVAYYIDQLWEADLVDMQEFAQYNDNYKYLLTVIDVLSKYAWAIPLKKKTGAEVVEAFQNIFKESGRKPLMLRTDRGKEFVNEQFKKLSETEKIHHYLTNNLLKACVAERFNRTLKEKMWKYFSANYTFKYIDVIKDLVDGYRKRKHSRTGKAPIEVNESNQQEVFDKLFPEYKNGGLSKIIADKKKNDIKVGDLVRISKDKTPFEKGYSGNWNEEIFKVDKITKPGSESIYKLVDESGEMISGSHYRPELQKVQLKRNKKFVIEKILEEKGNGKRKQYFVKWFGYPDKFNSWVSSIERTKPKRL